MKSVILMDVFVQGEPGLEGDPGPAGPDGAKVFDKIPDAKSHDGFL